MSLVRRANVMPDHADGEHGQGSEQDSQPVGSHTVRPPGPLAGVRHPTKGDTLQPETFRVRRKFHPRAPQRQCLPASGIAVIEVEGLEKLYGDLPGGPRALLPGAARGGAGPGRAQRRREDHDDPEHCRHHHTQPGQDPDRRARPGREAVAAKSLLAFIPDEPHLFDYLTVEEHLRFVGRLYQVADVDARIPGVLEELELASEAQRAAGRALARDEAEARDRLRAAARARGAAARRAAHRARSGRHPAHEGDDHAAGGGGRRRDPQLAPAAPGRGDLHPRPGDAGRTVGGVRDDRRDRGQPPGLHGRRLEDVFLALITPDGQPPT